MGLPCDISLYWASLAGGGVLLMPAEVVLSPAEVKMHGIMG